MINFKLLDDLGFTSNNTLTLNVRNFVSLVENKINGLICELPESQDPDFSVYYMADIIDSFRYLAENGVNVRLNAIVNNPYNLFFIGYLIDLRSNPTFAFHSYTGDNIVFGELIIVTYNDKQYLSIEYPLN